MTSRTRQIIGWIPAILVAIFLILASALPKFFVQDGTPTADFMKALGAWNIRYAIGALEVIIPILFVIPRTSTFGFILIVGLLGGATATSLTHSVPGNWPWFPLVILGVAMISVYFRNPEFLSRLLGKKR